MKRFLSIFLFGIVLLLVSFTADPATAQSIFSRSVLGMYAKYLEVEGDISYYCRKYDVDRQLVVAILLTETGGNKNLVSSKGARDLLQVWPSTRRSLSGRYKQNLSYFEAGFALLKYFEGQGINNADEKAAAYNAGEKVVLKPLYPWKLETAQYLTRFNHYLVLLRNHEEAIRKEASKLKLAVVRSGESWLELSERTGVSVMELRLYNVFLANLGIHPGQLIAYPETPSPSFQKDGDEFIYVKRHGDYYLHLAFAFGVEPDQFRKDNHLEPTSTLLFGDRVKITPSYDERQASRYVVKAGDTFDSILKTTGHKDVSKVILANQLYSQQLRPGSELIIPKLPPKAPAYKTHTVRRGESLYRIAKRYGTTVSRIMKYNGLSRTTLQVGQRLKIPGIG